MGSEEEKKQQGKTIKSMWQHGILGFLFLMVCIFFITHDQHDQQMNVSKLESELQAMGSELTKLRIKQSKLAPSTSANKNFVYPVKPPSGPAKTTSITQAVANRLGFGNKKSGPHRTTDPSKFNATKTGTESKHVLLEMYNANPIKLNDEQYIRDVFTSIVKTLGMTQVALSSQAMSPQGVSAVSLLTESHMSVHTWPELGYAAFDVFTCGHTEPLDAVPYLAKAFDIKKPEVDLIWAYIDRGQDETDDDDVTRLISTLYASKVLVEKKESKYQEIEIWEMYRKFPIDGKEDEHMYEQVATGVNGQPDQKNRCLFLDGIMMSCLHDEKTYHETLIHPAMIASPNPRRVAVLGGGEGASIRELLKYSSVEKAYMLELDNDVVDLCKRNLPTMSDGAYSNPRTDLRIGDAFDFFASPEAANLDALFLDILDIDEAPRELQDKLAGSEFISNLKKSLSKDGIIVVQMGELFGVNAANDMTNLEKQNDNQKWFIVEMLRYFNYAGAYSAPIPSFAGSWMFLVVTNSKASYDRFNNRDKSKIEADLKSRITGHGELQYVDTRMLQTMQGVPPIFRRHFCGLDDKRFSESTFSDNDLSSEDASRICDWAMMEGDEDILKHVKPGKEKVMTAAGILKTVGRKAKRA